MNDMNNNNSNKYYYKTYHQMPNNQHNRSHHPASMFDSQRNDYFNGPPGYMSSMLNNTNMIPSGGYNHFTNSYPPTGGNGPFYRDFRQNWQPQMMPPPQQPQHRPIQQQQPPPTQSTSSVAQGPLPTSSTSNLANRSLNSSTTTTTTNTTPSSSSSSSSASRNTRLIDEQTLAKLKQHLAVTQKELSRVNAEKLKLEVEEKRLQKIIDKSKSEVDRLESRLRDPRVKNRPDSGIIKMEKCPVEMLSLYLT